MPSSPDFVAHVLDLLADVGPVTARAMFGGHGIMLRGRMFGVLYRDELFLKADDEAQPLFEAAGCRQWAYPSRKGPMAMPYWRPPDEAHESAEAMRPWALLSVASAERKAAAKPKKASKKRRAPASRAPQKGRTPRARRRRGAVTS
jgi:DNA transformation protein